MSPTNLQYVSDEQGDITGVMVPIAVWKEIVSELETHHLLKSDAMRQRLEESLQRETGISFADALDQLGLR